MDDTPLDPPPMSIANVTTHAEHHPHNWHYPPISGPEANLIVGLLAAIVVVVGWVVVHRTALTREREAREHADRKEKESKRTELLSKLTHWKNTFVVVTDPEKTSRIYYTNGGMRELASAAEMFRGYVSDKGTFDRLNHAMSAMNPQTLDANGSDKRRETICTAINSFYDFNRNA